MSIRPFSNTELTNLKEAIERNGFNLEGTIENYFRYSIKKDKLILFTIKFPVSLPLRLNFPFEVVSFRISLAFKLWDLNQNTNKVIIFMLKMLRDLALQISLEHNFPIKGKETHLLEMLNQLMPEPITDENDSRWLNRVRISLMNKRSAFEEFDHASIDKIVNVLEKTRLKATFRLPWELENGVPKLRTSETLFFSNDEEFDEFFILEKGFFTFFKDLEYNKFYIRSSFESYTPYILYSLFKDSDFRIEVLVENWIKFSRMMINSLIEIISLADINQNDYIKFNPKKELDTEDFEFESNNFPFSALHYESIMSKGDLYQIHNDLFNTPPTNFEVIKSINSYIDAEEIIKNYRFDEATLLLNDSLKIFNKNRQKKVVVSILLKLREVAALLNKDDVAMTYLESALGVAKSGEVPAEYIIKIHYYLGERFFETDQYEKALSHFNIIINFIKSEEPSINQDEYLGMAYLYMGLINTAANNLAEAKMNFKNALQLGNNSIKVKLNYHLMRAKNYKSKGNLSQAQKLLRTGIDTVGLDYNEKEHAPILYDLVLELAEFYIHHRVDSKKAMFLMKSIENRLSLNLKKIDGIRRAIRWNLLMCDYYDILARDSDNSTHYYQQSQILINQLKKIGVIN
ncbi:MAG: tetratricopeptide repeat protein [Candidatus Hermodarchaeota archaeon]